MKFLVHFFWVFFLTIFFKSECCLHAVSVVFTNSKKNSTLFLKTDNPSETFRKMKQFYNEKKYKDVLKRCRNLIALYPQSRCSMESLAFWGKSLFKLGSYRLALVKFEELLDRYSGYEKKEEIVKYLIDIGKHFFYKDHSQSLFFFSSGYKYSIRVFECIIHFAPYSKYSDCAQFYLADSYRLSEQYQKALDGYRNILNHYANSLYCFESRFKVVLMEYLLSEDGFSGTKNLEEAIVQIELQMKQQEKMPRLEPLRKELQTLKNRIAEDFLNVALYYERRNRFKSALLYYRNFCKNYSYHKKSSFVRDKIASLEKKLNCSRIVEV